MRISDWSSDVCSSDLEAQFPASFDERGRVHCLGKWQAGFVEILRYACRDEDRFGIPADPDELAVGKCVGNKILGGGIARHQRCALGGDKDHHCIEQDRSEEHTSELQSLMRISYAVFCLKKKNTKDKNTT